MLTDKNPTLVYIFRSQLQETIRIKCKWKQEDKPELETEKMM